VQALHELTAHAHAVGVLGHEDQNDVQTDLVQRVNVENATQLYESGNGLLSHVRRHVLVTPVIARCVHGMLPPTRVRSYAYFIEVELVHVDIENIRHEYIHVL
jgi:hypothetical protein